jgi:hypothetical protein
MDHGPRTTENGQRCSYCPIPESLRCAGFEVRRFCELIDPSCPQFDSGYVEVIARETRLAGEDDDLRHASSHQTDFSKQLIEERATIIIPVDCCGGGVPPGVFDEPGD